MDEALSRAGIEHVIVDTGQLQDAIIRAGVDASVVLICGSLPPGAPATFVRDRVRTLKDSAVDVVVDTSGDALKRSVGRRGHGESGEGADGLGC